MERVGMVGMVWFLFLLHPLRFSYAKYTDPQGNALLAFKDKLTDPNHELEDWDPYHNPCNWFGIICFGGGLVARIDLGNLGLSGTLAPELGQLKSLHYLELHGNSISGTIPDELGDLTSLVSLDLYINNFNGPIPSSLGQLSQLRFLRLNGNRLTGSIPVSLTNIQSLSVLDLSNNDRSGVVPVNGSFSKFTPVRTRTMLILILHLYRT